MSGYSPDWEDDFDYDSPRRGGILPIARKWVDRTETIKVTHPIVDPENIWEFINQTKIWKDANLAEIRIKDMDKFHLFNVLKWADKNQDEIQFTLEYALRIGKITDEALLDNPLNMPLFVRMQSQYFKLVGVK